jgi:hypothetical protein
MTSHSAHILAQGTIPSFRLSSYFRISGRSDFLVALAFRPFWLSVVPAVQSVLQFSHRSDHCKQTKLRKKKHSKQFTACFDLDLASVNGNFFLHKNVMFQWQITIDHINAQRLASRPNLFLVVIYL